MDPQQPPEALLREIELVLLKHAQLEPAIMEYPEILPAPPLLKYPELLPALPLLKYPEMLPAPPLLKYPEMLSALPLLESCIVASVTNNKPGACATAGAVLRKGAPRRDKGNIGFRG
ncbi:UNVERIFIED_CONTAM: hypothetical protein FKN15_074040 [Acipenser sinensis]